jgi:putative ABC transport system permease protein
VIDSLYIAWRYIRFYRVRTAILVACVTLIAALPLGLQLLLDESEKQLISRAQSTPLLLGARGSALDLVMNSLYFDDEEPELISMRATDEIDESGLAIAVPLYARFQAHGYPIIGTTLDYFDFRGLAIDQGRQIALLGEAVIGADVAEELGIGPGDSLLSTPETLFDLAGVYPLKMKVVGVLSRSFTPDDRAVLVDLKTSWVIQGLGHGHQDLATVRDRSVVIRRDDTNIIASAKLDEFTEITPENIDSFHFHGASGEYPLTALVVLPNDERAGTILRGRFLDASSSYQLVLPGKVIDGLLANIFRIKEILDAVILVVGTATALALVLVFALSLRLRQREIHTLFRIGGSRSTIARLLAAEIAFILVFSASLCALAMFVIDRSSDDLVRSLFIG